MSSKLLNFQEHLRIRVRGMDRANGGPSTARAGGLPYFTLIEDESRQHRISRDWGWILDAFRVLSGPIDMDAPGGGIEKPSQCAASFDVLDHLSL